MFISLEVLNRKRGKMAVKERQLDQTKHNLTNLDKYADFVAAAKSQSSVSGLTHNHYKYPARFSPEFAAAAIRAFSQKGDLVLDPFVGGGATAVEGMVAGRKVIVNDLNPLGTFVTNVKTSRLNN